MRPSLRSRPTLRKPRYRLQFANPVRIGPGRPSPYNGGMSTCPNCPSALEEAGALLKCPACNIYLTPSSVQTAAEENPVELEEQVKAPVRLPAKIRLNRATHGLEMKWAWSRTAGWAFGLFALFWNGFIGFALMDTSGLMRVFLLPFVAVGLGLAYLALGCALNSSTLRVNTRELSVATGPIPFGTKTWGNDVIKQLYCQEYQAGHVGGKPIMRYKVMMLIDGKKPEELVSDLEQLEEALYIEQEVEKTLKIKDRAVEGEFKR